MSDRETTGRVETRALVRAFFRSYLVCAAFNTRGLQSVGLAFAMRPILDALYPEPYARRLAWRRYLPLYNTHPFWSPLIIGIFARMEILISKGQFPESMFEDVKKTAVYTLSGLGDSLFGAGLPMVFALVAAGLCATGRVGWAVALACVIFVALQVFRALTFFMGWREGFRVLAKLRAWRLMDVSYGLKYLAALLLVGFWAVLWSMAASTWLFALEMSACLVACLAVYHLRLPRNLMALALSVAFLGLSMAGVN